MEIMNFENGKMEGYFKGYTFVATFPTMSSMNINTVDENGNVKQLPAKIEDQVRKEINEYFID